MFLKVYAAKTYGTIEHEGDGANVQIVLDEAERQRFHELAVIIYNERLERTKASVELPSLPAPVLDADFEDAPAE